MKMIEEGAESSAESSTRRLSEDDELRMLAADEAVQSLLLRISQELAMEESKPQRRGKEKGDSKPGAAGREGKRTNLKQGAEAKRGDLAGASDREGKCTSLKQGASGREGKRTNLASGKQGAAAKREDLAGAPGREEKRTNLASGKQGKGDLAGAAGGDLSQKLSRLEIVSRRLEAASRALNSCVRSITELYRSFSPAAIETETEENARHAGSRTSGSKVALGRGLAASRRVGSGIRASALGRAQEDADEHRSLIVSGDQLEATLQSLQPPRDPLHCVCIPPVGKERYGDFSGSSETSQVLLQEGFDATSFTELRGKLYELKIINEEKVEIRLGFPRRPRSAASGGQVHPL